MSEYDYQTALAAVRTDIDAIDAKLLPLLEQRMDAAKRVAQIKQKAALPVLNARREDEILQSVREHSPKYGEELRVVYSSMMDVSRAVQHKILAGGKDLREQITAAQSSTFNPNGAYTVVCQGVDGAYSSIAARKLFPNGTLDYVGEFGGVFQRVASGDADYGVIPIENSWAGSVHESFDLIMKHRLHIVGAVDLPIHHCLLGVPGATLGDVRQVMSHPQGLAQCGRFIKAHGFDEINYSNTATAAKDVAAAGDKSVAAIASIEAARAYGLQVLEENIQSSEENVTRLIAISRNLQIRDNADRISLIFTLPNVTGSLYRTLARFALCGLNLTKLESRPTKDRNFDYYFYLDFVGTVRNPQTADLLCALYEELPVFNLLGNYPEISP